jgi:hypothetical protein
MLVHVARQPHRARGCHAQNPWAESISAFLGDALDQEFVLESADDSMDRRAWQLDHARNLADAHSVRFTLQGEKHFNGSTDDLDHENTTPPSTTSD